MPLEFASGNYTIRYGGRLMGGKPDVVAEAVHVTIGTKPGGSTWRRNPIPNCNCDKVNGHCTAPANGTIPSDGYVPTRTAYEQQEMPSWYKKHRAAGGYVCDTGFQFPPPAEGVYGLGAGRGVPGRTLWNPTGDDWAVFRIGDEVRVPKQEGEFVLQWRWDCEESSQVWVSCADIRIVAGVVV